MDQDSFRRLLQTSKTPTNGSSNTFNSRGSLLAHSASVSNKQNQKTVNAPQSSFKPRKVKKQAGSSTAYRDRAVERREGGGNDYAQVEAVLEEFERRNKDNEDQKAVEEQRKYLGGDSDHSILVKGLDFALLEQNKARAALETGDDESLEQAFVQASPGTDIGTGGIVDQPKKRTREELIRELKAKRDQSMVDEGRNGAEKKVSAVDEAKALEEAKKAGKFKPIGFKPVEEEKVKKRKVRDKEKSGKNGERRKKRKGDGGGKEKDKIEQDKPEGNKGVDGEADGHVIAEAPSMSTTATTMGEPYIPKTQLNAPPVEESPEDFDIFAGVGEYQGVDLGDDDDDDERDDNAGDRDLAMEAIEEIQGQVKTNKWFTLDNTELPAASALGHNEDRTTAKAKEKVKSSTPPPREPEDGEFEQPMRLQPLESSAVPSIKDLLAINEAAEAEEKRRKRKEKKKAKGGGRDGTKISVEAKADRDYKRLKSYQEKKGGSV